MHADHLDTPRLLTNPSGQVAWRARYESFGKAVVESDPDGNGTPITFNLRFPGQYFDAETGLHYNYLRDYEPSSGRYIQADPVGQREAINLFAYVANNPVRLIDPLGLAIYRRRGIGPDTFSDIPQIGGECHRAIVGKGGYIKDWVPCNPDPPIPPVPPPSPRDFPSCSVDDHWDDRDLTDDDSDDYDDSQDGDGGGPIDSETKKKRWECFASGEFLGGSYYWSHLAADYVFLHKGGEKVGETLGGLFLYTSRRALPPYTAYQGLIGIPKKACEKMYPGP